MVLLESYLAKFIISLYYFLTYLNTLWLPYADNSKIYSLGH